MKSQHSSEATSEPLQRVVKIRRDYNTWVANETLEDYALRFTPHSFRKWSEMRVANTAFGASSFLVLEAVGATMLVNSGFINAFWAILATGLIIFLIGLPISHAAARYGLDMDLLTRGAGFGYIGSTITSLIYASFTFIFFALEAAIMAYALELAFSIPPSWGYLICALAVIPLVTHGVTVISRLQAWTQPLWLALLVLPYVFLLIREPEVLGGLLRYPGEQGLGGEFSMPLFGAALTVGIALVTQMGEQADYLRFMPERTAQNRRRWWLGMILGGPGWVLPGVAKMLGGALLAYLALRNAVPAAKAVDPNQMYLIGFSHVFSNSSLAIGVTVLFVVISQIKINVTNAYAGSLAWSNFFARLTHSHPGRVVWVVFNTLIALLLMELDVFQALGQILGLYSNIAISWMAAVVADLVINKPLGLSPPAHRIQAQPSLRHQSGRRRRHGHRLAALDRGVQRPLRRHRAAVCPFHLHADGLCRGAADRLADCRPLLPRRAQRRCRDRHAALLHLRTRIRERRHGTLPGLLRHDLFALLFARCALRRPVQARFQSCGAVERHAAPLPSGRGHSLPGNRPRTLPAADGLFRPAAGRAARPALYPRSSRPRGGSSRFDPGICNRPSSRPSRRCCCYPASAPGGWS